MGLFGLLLAGLLLPSLGGAFAAQRPLAQAALLLSGLAWAGLVWLALGFPSLFSGTKAGCWILGGALLLRGAVALGDPLLSDDVHRYVWEGGLVAEGVSPYAWSPDAPELQGYRERWPGVYGRMNNTDVSAAYPPLAQATFALVTWLCGGPEAGGGRTAVRGMRLAFCGFDLLLVALLLWRFRAHPGRVLVWAWSPLVALEFAGSAHFDSLGILLFVAAVLVFERGSRPKLLGLGCLALGVLVKFLPLAALPFASQQRRGLGRSVLLFGAFFGLGFVPLFWLVGGFGGLTAGLSQYASRWESFNLLFRPLEGLLAASLGDQVLGLDPGGWARLLVLGVLASVGCWAWLQRRSTLCACFSLIACFLLLTPTLHPWYLTWLIPFLAFRPSAAWTWLLLIAPLLYWPLTEWQARGEWIEPGWLWPVVCLPFFGLLLAQALGKLPLPVDDVSKLN